MSKDAKSSLNDKEINALISLLDDPDKQIHTEVISKLMSLGENIIPSLENAWESSFDPVLQKKIEELIHEIQLDIIAKKLENWCIENSDDLLSGVILVARHQYPDVDSKKIIEQIDKIQQDIWIELNENLTALEKIKVFNQVFYKIYKFSGNISNLLDPQNSYINIVLETKKGNPITLGVIYLIIAQRLKIPVYGVNLPQHFILAYINDQKAIELFSEGEHGKDLPKSNDVLFYINSFNKGSIFSKKEIFTYLNKLKLDPYLPDDVLNEKYFSPCSNITIIQLLIEQLMESYLELGYNKKVDDLRNLLEVLMPAS